MARVAKNKDDKMDFLIYAIKRMAAAQEESNKLALQIIEQNRKSYELNSKQYTLNIDNHKFNLASDDLAAQYKAGVEEAMDSAKKYIDEQYNNLWKMTQQQVSLLLSAHHDLETKLDIKGNQEKVAESIAKRMMNSIKGKGLI